MPPPAALDVWVLAGQSNMEGVGDLATALPPDERVWCFTSAGQWEVAQEPLHKFWESCTPIHQALCRAGLPVEQQSLSDAELAARQREERTWGAGLGIAFGRQMAEALNRPIGLIAAAHGGTSLAQWSPELKALGGASLYGAMLWRIAQAGGRLRGVLWYQGESDGWDPAAGQSYGDRFAHWIARLRADLNAPRLPVLTVQIGNTTLDSPNPTAWNAVRQAQYLLPDQVPQTAVTTAIDLPLEDIIHITSGGLIRLGHRLARQALALTAGQGTIGPRVERLERMPDRARGQGEVRIHCRNVCEGWQPADHLGGFSLITPDGRPLPDNYVFNAYRDPDDPTAIRLRMNLPPPAGTLIAYGDGLRPYCNAVDAADMPLCAFRFPVRN
jgi:hypothetical protein